MDSSLRLTMPLKKKNLYFSEFKERKDLQMNFLVLTVQSLVILDPILNRVCWEDLQLADYEREHYRDENSLNKIGAELIKIPPKKFKSWGFLSHFFISIVGLSSSQNFHCRVVKVWRMRSSRAFLAIFLRWTRHRALSIFGFNGHFLHQAFWDTENEWTELNKDSTRRLYRH